MSSIGQMTENGVSTPNGAWLSLMDYAMRKSVSLSTLRRYIKANKIRYKVENGRYFLLDEEAIAPQTHDTVLRLQAELQHAQEEIAELKMLIALYEERMGPLRLDN